MKRAWWANAGLCLLIFLLFGYGVKRVAEAPDLESLLSPEVRPRPAAAARADQVRLDGYRFELIPAAKRVKAAFTVRNDGREAVRDLRIHCDLHDRAGELWGRATWLIHDSVAPGTTGSFTIEDKRFIPHQVTADSIVCTIIDLDAPGAAAVAASGSSGH